MAKRGGRDGEVGGLVRLLDLMAAADLGRSKRYRMVLDETFSGQIRLTARRIRSWEADMTKWLHDRRDGRPQA